MNEYLSRHQFVASTPVASVECPTWKKLGLVALGVVGAFVVAEILYDRPRKRNAVVFNWRGFVNP